MRVFGFVKHASSHHGISYCCTLITPSPCRNLVLLTIIGIVLLNHVAVDKWAEIAIWGDAFTQLGVRVPG